MLRGDDDGVSRVTVNLSKRAATSLDRLTSSTGGNKTDVINRALQVYVLVEELLERGGGVLQVARPDGGIDQVRIVL